MEVMCDEMESGRMHVRLTQGLGDRVELAAEVDVRGDQLGVRDPRSLARCAERGGPCVDHFRHVVVTAGASLSLRLVSTVWFSLFAGHTVFRRLDQFDEDHALLPGGRLSPDEGWAARARLVWRVPMPGKSEAADR